MNKPNVFVHGDNTLSAPFCPCGENLVRQALMRGIVIHNITDCCNTIGCTCSNDSYIERKATPNEAAEFYKGLAMMADGALYEINHNL